MSDVSCMCSVIVGLLLLCWCACVGLAAMLLFVAVCCLVHVANIIHAFAVLIAFRSVCLLVLALAGIASVRGPGRKPGTGLFSLSLADASKHFFDEQANFQKPACARLASILAEKVE